MKVHSCKDSLFSTLPDIFTIFAAYFKAMQLSEDQKNFLKCSLTQPQKTFEET